MRKVSNFLLFYLCLLNFARGGRLATRSPKVILSNSELVLQSLEKKDTFYSHARPLHSRGDFAFSTRLWNTCSENVYLKMVCQNDVIILLIYSLKRTNSVLQEHEEALKKKKEMVLNKTQLTRQDYQIQRPFKCRALKIIASIGTAVHLSNQRYHQ